MKTTNGTTRRNGFPWMVGALSLVSLGLGACSHGWLWDGSDKGGPATGGTVGGEGTGGVFGIDAGYGADGAFATGGTVGYGDAGTGIPVDGCVAAGTGGILGYDGGIGTGGGTATGLGTGGTIGTACFSVAFDHDVLCDDIVTAKDQAYADCQAHGLDLVDFGPAADCHAGDKRRLSYTCCPHTDPPPPTRDPNSCVSRVKGDGQTCQSDLALSGLAQADCEASDYDVAQAEPFAGCGGDGHLFLSYLCCTRDGSIIPPPQPDPVPTSPFDGPLVTGPSRYAEYKCCTAPTSCTVEKLGSDTDCKTADAWTAQATAACSATGGTLYGVPQYVSCAP